MAIATAIAPPFTAVNNRYISSNSSFFRFYSSTIQLPRTLKSIAICSGQIPNFRVFSSMSIQATEKSSPTSFLDRKESGILHFVKYHGLGNDFILVDNRDSEEPKITPDQAVKLCDRNFGIGADGVIFATPGVNGTDYTMRIFNSDGSEPEVRVDMGEPILKASEIPTKLTPNKDQSAVKEKLDVNGLIWNVTCVSMGNPHCVTFGTESRENLFKSSLQVTLKCVFGSVGQSCTVDLPGGPLDIEWREDDNHVYMTGPAELGYLDSSIQRVMKKKK
ncbi:hypothetical protein DH2020_015079 [Rehmannia glutinosa]|uniref:Diaminopimelate epimerase n=1 Tax=Rehmannia glutinosa TaxID=99300 RepID=A0ABR0X1H2_REHGL